MGLKLELPQFPLDRTAAVVPIALLLLTAAGGLIWANLSGRSARPSYVFPPVSAPSPLRPTLLATTAIAPGHILALSDFSVAIRESPKVPSLALSRAEDAEGRVVLVPIAANAPILPQNLSATAVKGISPQVPAGYRAYAVPVSEADIAGGFLQAGDSVDLYVTLPGALFSVNDPTASKKGDQSKSTLLLQAITVLAVGTKLKTDGTANPSVRTVTLALNTEDLAKVALANRLGTISFAIRNPADKALQPSTQAGLATLVNEREKPSAATAAIRVHAHGVTLYSGHTRSTIALP
jgi:pilus assembly protein CpaB